MNNGRYRRAMDFARLSYYADCGFLDRGLRTGSMALMVAATARYRQALQLFQSYTIVTKVQYFIRYYFSNSFCDKLYCSLIKKCSKSSKFQCWVSVHCLEQCLSTCGPWPTGSILV